MTIGVRTFSIQDETFGYSRTAVAILFAYGMVLWSPITAALGLRWSYLLALVAFSMLVLCVLTARPIKIWFLSLSIACFLPASITAFYWAEPRFLLFAVPFVVAIFLLAQSTPKEIERFVDYSSFFLLVVLAGGVIGFALALSGMAPTLEFQRHGVEDQQMYLFLTTLANEYWNPVIRPSGIYDEAGALSFVVCLIAFMRHSMGKDFRLTWALLLLGFVTLSLAHLIFVLVFFLSQPFTVRRISYLLLVAGLIAIPLASADVRQVFGQRLFARAALTSEGTLAGDNRTLRLMNSWNVILEHDAAIYVGVDPACSFNEAECEAKYPPIGENPLQHLAERGIFVSWPYYAFMGIGVFLPLLGRKNLAFFGVVLLFAQRPYLLSFGYALLGVLAIWLQFSESSGDAVAMGWDAT